MKKDRCNPDEFQRESPEQDSMVERRNILKSGLATTFVFAGGAVLSVISCLRDIFSPSDDTPESL